MFVYIRIFLYTQQVIENLVLELSIPKPALENDRARSEVVSE